MNGSHCVQILQIRAVLNYKPFERCRQRPERLKFICIFDYQDFQMLVYVRTEIVGICHHRCVLISMTTFLHIDYQILIVFLIDTERVTAQGDGVGINALQNIREREWGQIASNERYVCHHYEQRT